MNEYRQIDEAREPMLFNCTGCGIVTYFDHSLNDNKLCLNCAVKELERNNKQKPEIIKESEQ